MRQLTSRERLDRCFKHLETDRPGLFLRGATASSPAHPSYQPLRDLAVAYGDLKSGWSYRHLVEPLNLTYETEPYSEDFERRITVLHTPAGALRASHLVGLKGQPGLHEKFLLEAVEDAEKYLSLPRPKIEGDVSSFFEVDQQAGDRGIVEVGIGFNPGGFVAELFGSTQFALFSIEHRDVLHALMKQKMDTIIHILKYLLDRGVGPYFATLGQEYITPPLHGPRDFYDFNVQYDRPIMDLVHEAGGYVHVHSHGPLKDVLPAFVDLGVDVLHPLEAPPYGRCDAQDGQRGVPQQGVHRGQCTDRGHV